MSLEEYDQYPRTLEMRECRLKIKSPASRKKEITIATTILNPKVASKKSLSSLLKQRWFGELFLRNIKSTMDIEMLRCKTPDMIQKEIWANIIVYNLVCRAICQAAVLSDQLPSEISFKDTIQTLTEFRNVWLYSSKTSNSDIYAEFLLSIAKMKVGKRPGRIEPRQIKRRTKKQYGLLSKPRAEARKALLHNS